MKKAWSLLCAVLLAANLTAALPTAAVAFGQFLFRERRRVQ